MTVYVVIWEPDADTTMVEGIFSSREKAEEFVKARLLAFDYEVIAWDVDGSRVP